MKTYPYQDGDRLIQLVEKSELDQLLERLAEARESHLAASARDVQMIQRQSVELSKREVLAKMLATALDSSAKLYENPEPPSMHELSMRAYDMRCIARQALSANLGRVAIRLFALLHEVGRCLEVGRES